MKQPDMYGIKRFLRPVVYGIVAGTVACFLLLTFMSVVMQFRDLPQMLITFVATLTFVLGGCRICQRSFFPGTGHVGGSLLWNLHVFTACIHQPYGEWSRFLRSGIYQIGSRVVCLRIGRGSRGQQAEKVPLNRLNLSEFMV